MSVFLFFCGRINRTPRRTRRPCTTQSFVLFLLLQRREGYVVYTPETKMTGKHIDRRATPTQEKKISRSSTPTQTHTERDIYRHTTAGRIRQSIRSRFSCRLDHDHTQHQSYFVEIGPPTNPGWRMSNFPTASVIFGVFYRSMFAFQGTFSATSPHAFSIKPQKTVHAKNETEVAHDKGRSGRCTRLRRRDYWSASLPLRKQKDSTAVRLEEGCRAYKQSPYPWMAPPVSGMLLSW